MNFPERVICGQDYIPSFSEVQREKGEKTSGKQVETMLKRMKQSQKKNQKMRKKRGQSFHALFEFTTLPKFLHVWIGGSPNPLLSDFYGDFITQICLIKSFAIGDLFQFQLHFLPQRSPSNHLTSSPGNQPHPQMLPKSLY